MCNRFRRSWPITRSGLQGISFPTINVPVLAFTISVLHYTLLGPKYATLQGNNRTTPFGRQEKTMRSSGYGYQLAPCRRRNAPWGMPRLESLSHSIYTPQSVRPPLPPLPPPSRIRRSASWVRHSKTSTPRTFQSPRRSSTSASPMQLLRKSSLFRPTSVRVSTRSNQPSVAMTSSNIGK